MIHQLLSLLRDEIVDVVVSKRQSVSLNFLIGTLNIAKNGSVEFKSASVSSHNAEAKGATNKQNTGSGRLTADGLKQLSKSVANKNKSELDQKSKVSQAERSISFI